MWIDEETEKREKKWEQEQKRAREEYAKKLAESNKLLDAPDSLSAEERTAWDYIVNMLKSGGNYIKTHADVELVTQYTQVKVMRDRAWIEWNKNPERYIRIVTGASADGKTPKITLKENEHYKILNDCNKKMEKLLDDLKLTPKARTRR